MPLYEREVLRPVTGRSSGSVVEDLDAIVEVGRCISKGLLQIFFDQVRIISKKLTPILIAAQQVENAFYCDAQPANARLTAHFVTLDCDAVERCLQRHLASLYRSTAFTTARPLGRYGPLSHPSKPALPRSARQSRCSSPMARYPGRNARPNRRRM